MAKRRVIARATVVLDHHEPAAFRTSLGSYQQPERTAGVSTGRWVFLCKDASNFPGGITKAVDNSGRYVTYTYSNGTTDQLRDVYFPSYSTTAEIGFGYGTGNHLGDIENMGGFGVNLGLAYDSSNRLYELAYDGSLTNPFQYTLNSNNDIESVTATMPKGSRDLTP
jgi:hypothetical protein